MTQKSIDKFVEMSYEPVPHKDYSESSSKHYGNVGDYSTTTKPAICKVAYV